MTPSPLFILQQKANELLASVGIVGQIPVPAEKIVEHLGFECHLFEPDDKTNNISGAVNHHSKKIFINEYDPPKRQLFTVAHEIAHIVLHDHQDYIDYRLNDFTDPKEKEANDFAGCLLMPDELFCHHWKRLNGDLNKLSDLFGVSASAIAVRGNILNLE